jgi:hypothetical protein
MRLDNRRTDDPILKHRRTERLEDQIIGTQGRGPLAWLSSLCLEAAYERLFRRGAPPATQRFGGEPVALLRVIICIPHLEHNFR